MQIRFFRPLIYLSHLDGKLTWAGWHVYMDKNIAGMKPFKCLSSHPSPRWNGSGSI